jgi:hypothetical protein
MSTLDMALTYAKRGWPVFPCTIKKKPCTSHGFYDATTEPAKIREWWQAHKDAAIGVPTGTKMGAWVLDVDLPDGPVTLAALEKKHGPLPTTAKQQTGSGGWQLFFKWPADCLVKNNAKTKLGPGLDVRGEGGYVIMPPSFNEKGQYKWITKGVLVDAPAWLLDLVIEQEKPRRVEPIRSEGTTRYGKAALDDEAGKVAMAPNGARNETLNAGAYSMGRLIAGGELDQDEAELTLLEAALRAGLPETEARKTIASGISGGMKDPKSAPRDLEYVTETPEVSETSETPEMSDTPDKVRHCPTDSDIVRQIPTRSDKSDNGQNGLNLWQQIKEWVTNSSGSFTSADIDREFGLTTRAEKKARADALVYLYKNNTIERDKIQKGKYHVISVEIEEVDWDADDLEEFPVRLPLGLDDIVSIGPRNVILVEGCTNAGKTAFCLQTLALNLNADYPLWYLFSEGSPGEVKSRLRNGRINLDRWKERVHASARSTLQHQIIKQKNPDGLTIVDFLEPLNGEYYRLGTQVSEMWESLRQGVAVVCVQKKTGCAIGRGGEAIREKPRLALTLDLLEKQPGYLICVLKIEKCKTPKVYGQNPDGKEIHFAVVGGLQLFPLSNWGYFKDEERRGLVPGYMADVESTFQIPQGDRTDVMRRAKYAYQFTLDDGSKGGVVWADVEKWKEQYPNVSVEQELKKLEESSTRSLRLSKKGWIFKVHGILAQMNNAGTPAEQVGW